MVDYVTTFNVKDANDNDLHSITFDPRDGIGSASIVDSPFNYTYTSLSTFYPTFQVPGLVGKVEPVTITTTGQIANVSLEEILTASKLHALYDNIYIDQTVYSDNNVLTSCRIRIYSVAASVGTSSDVVQTFMMTATESDGNLLTYKTVRV